MLIPEIPAHIHAYAATHPYLPQALRLIPPIVEKHFEGNTDVSFRWELTNGIVFLLVSFVSKNGENKISPIQVNIFRLTQVFADIAYQSATAYPDVRAYFGFTADTLG